LQGLASLQELQETRAALELDEEIVLGISYWADILAHIVAFQTYPYAATFATTTASEMADASGNAKAAFEQQRELFIRYVLMGAGGV
jgi:hypothetical protein